MTTQQKTFEDILKTGSIPELASEGANLLCYYQDVQKADNCVPSTIRVLERIESLTGEVPLALQVGITNARKAYLNDAETAEDVLADFIQQLGCALLPIWPELGQKLVESMTFETNTSGE